MNKIAVILTILLQAFVSHSQQSCLDLFKSNTPEVLSNILKAKDAQARFKLFSEAAGKILEDRESAQTVNNPRAKAAMSVLRAASFQNRKARAVHEGLIEKRAAVLMEKLEELYDQPDAFGRGDKNLQEFKRAARESVYIAGVRMLAEQAGFEIIPHWSFKSFYATRTTIWWNVIKPLVRSIMLKFPNRHALFTEEEAMDVLWAGELDPSLLLDQKTATHKLRILRWWRGVGDHAPEIMGSVLTAGMIAYGSYVYGMIDSAVVAGHARHVESGVQAALSIKSLQAEILNDTPEAIYQKTLEEYLIRHPGKTKADIPASYKEEAKAFIRLGEEDLSRYKFSDDKP